MAIPPKTYRASRLLSLASGLEIQADAVLQLQPEARRLGQIRRKVVSESCRSAAKRALCGRDYPNNRSQGWTERTGHNG